MTARGSGPLRPRGTGSDSAPRRLEWSWEDYRREAFGAVGAAGFNIAHLAVDRHVASGRARQAAFRFLGPRGARSELTYEDLAEQTNRFANVLRRLGIGPGETVATLLGRCPQLSITALGALKARAVYSPLFSSFGPEPVRARLALGEARVLVTTETLYRRKVEPIRSRLPRLEHVLLVDGETPATEAARFPHLLAQAPAFFEIPRTDKEDPALLHFTSGTTGTPKGALHVHDAALVHHATARHALGLGPGAVYWCTADPGWVTGISYGLIAPLLIGATAVVDTEEFDAERWYEILSHEGVEIWYTAPTAIRMLMRGALDPAARFEFPRLRHLASVGEPLEAEAVRWGREAFGTPFHDTWWQTETGGIMIANVPGEEISPGSMGRAVHGINADVVHTAGGDVTPAAPGDVAQLAIETPWPSMFRSYRGDPDRYQRCFAGGWYLTGDLARRDRNGCFWFVGRADDAIQSAGHLIGPFEVEAVMMEHPAVADAAAVGRPDALAFEIVVCCLVLHRGRSRTADLERDLLAHARRRLGPAVAPRALYFRDALPRTPSGKILRRQLRDEIAGSE